VIVSALDEATLARMREEAAAGRNPFVDPQLIRKAETTLAGVAGVEWLSRVAGRPVSGWRQLGHHELIVAVRAAEADVGYFQALRAERAAAQAELWRIDKAAAAAAAAAERQEWEDLRVRLPVLIDVWHNWTARHLDGYEQGADHIVALSGFTAGRLRRAAGQTLCCTPSRAHELRHVFTNTGDENRIPNCKACLRHARRLAGGFR
jgi:hypothetical protein